MKNTKILTLLALMVCFTFGMIACGGGTEKAADKDGKEYTSAYICPMHCKGSGSDKAGKCPVCKMDYVANKDGKKEGHEGHDHDGHDHDGHNH